MFTYGRLVVVTGGSVSECDFYLSLNDLFCECFWHMTLIYF